MRFIVKFFMSFYRHILIFGIPGISIFRKVRTNNTESLRLPGIKASIALRSMTSDIPIFYEIFWKNEYEIKLDFKPKFIIDAGANIGLAAILFSNKYPSSKIISIEPEISNFKMMEKNLETYSNVTLLQRALSNKDNLDVVINDSVKGNWGFTTELVDGDNRSTKGYTVKTISIPEIMKENSVEYLDLVKIDIEGAEKDVFESGYEYWLPRTRCLIIELHDRLQIGCSKNLFKAVSAYNFHFSQSGENLVFKNLDLLS
jgi:FkbM family methyltransferase